MQVLFIEVEAINSFKSSRYIDKEWANITKFVIDFQKLTKALALTVDHFCSTWRTEQRIFIIIEYNY